MIFFNKRKFRAALINSIIADVEILLSHCNSAANHITSDVTCAIVKCRLDEAIELLRDIRKLLNSK